MDTLAGAEMQPPIDPTARSFALLDQAERDRLGTLLRSLAWLDGLIAAVVVAPTDDEETEDWIDYVWQEEKEDEVGNLTLKQADAMVAPVMAHYFHVCDTLFEAPEAYRPYLAGSGDPSEAASQWAAGFCAGISVNTEAWAPLFADQEALPLLVAILSLVHEADMPEDVRADSPFRAMPPERLEHMRRSAVEMLPEIVLALHDHSMDLGEDLDLDDEDIDGSQGTEQTHVRAAPKVGRNDPCPCGSGKKYKQCCLE